MILKAFSNLNGSVVPAQDIPISSRACDNPPFLGWRADGEMFLAGCNCPAPFLAFSAEEWADFTKPRPCIIPSQWPHSFSKNPLRDNQDLGLEIN